MGLLDDTAAFTGAEQSADDLIPSAVYADDMQAGSQGAGYDRLDSAHDRHNQHRQRMDIDSAAQQRILRGECISGGLWATWGGLDPCRLYANACKA